MGPHCNFGYYQNAEQHPLWYDHWDGLGIRSTMISQLAVPTLRRPCLGTAAHVFLSGWRRKSCIEVP